MKTIKFIDSKKPVLVSVTCDKCHKEYTVGDDEKDELQEFHHIGFTGGYSSVFGDETHVKCDICQHCLYPLIKDFMVTMTVIT